ncbi:MAG: hypothetical protein ACRC0L_06940 [Angustibacter sp.]
MNAYIWTIVVALAAVAGFAVGRMRDEAFRRAGRVAGVAVILTSTAGFIAFMVVTIGNSGAWTAALAYAFGFALLPQVLRRTSRARGAERR